MKKNYLLLLCFFFIAAILNSCSDDDATEDEDYIQISPVVLNITQVPYPKLSEYKFFEGDLKNQEPAYKVLPYKPNSELFTDYAHKKRFVWMPPGTKATYDGDDNVLKFPVGAVLIKTFYYDNVQPANATKIIETRLLIKIADETPTNSGWKMYDYIWNEEQTDADLDVAGFGKVVPISFMENNVLKTTDYKVPAASQCATCHKLNPTQTENGEISIPIGVKPQNLNYNFTYDGTSVNQLKKWQDEGYLDNTLPSTINSVVDWKDTSKSLELRVRSYIDINCAHCHRDGAHCDYVPARFNFSNSNLGTLGVCMVPVDVLEGTTHVIKAGDAAHSELIARISSTQESVMMPIMGRTLVHEEAVQMISAWINSLPPTCN